MSLKRLLCYPLSFCWIWYASASQAQINLPPENIRVHGIMQMEDASLDFVLLTKGHNKLKATIQDPKQQAKIQLTYNNSKFYSEELLNGVLKIKQFKGDEAASNLFDLLALNPGFHFQKWNQIKSQMPQLKGYDIKYNLSDKLSHATKKQIPISLELYSSTAQLIRRIDFISFHSASNHYLQPKELLFTDVSTKESGRLIVHKFEYNSGLPDFLFKLPKAHQGKPN